MSYLIFNSYIKKKSKSNNFDCNLVYNIMSELRCFLEDFQEQNCRTGKKFRTRVTLCLTLVSLYESARTPLLIICASLAVLFFL